MIYLILVAGIVVFDLFSKYLAKKNNFPVEIVRNKLYISVVKNKGAMYNLLDKSPVLLNCLSAIVMLGTIFVFIKNIFSKDASRLTKSAFSFVVAGGIGNVYERFRHKEVTDFIYFKWKKAPVFNFADVSILIGVILVFVSELKKK